MASLNRQNMMFNRVPKVTVAFWIIKLLAVTMGETAADYLAVNLGLGLSATSAQNRRYSNRTRTRATSEPKTKSLRSGRPGSRRVSSGSPPASQNGTGPRPCASFSSRASRPPASPTRPKPIRSM